MALSPDDFMQSPAVTAALAKLKAPRTYSDVVDDDGHQYVDLVMEGGGVLGIGLLGYVYALESAGIRFLGVGGASAGAINALLAASADTPANPKSPRSIALLSQMDMWSFVDGDDDARDFVQAMVNGAGMLKLGWKAAQILDNVMDDLGLNPGLAFQAWLEEALESFGIGTNAELAARMRELPRLWLRGVDREVSKAESDPKLGIVAAELTTESKVVFPDMAHLYWAQPSRVNPALFVRASMSIPFFFHPLRISGLPASAAAKAEWKALTGYTGPIPDEVLFVDGGIISNFPIDLFHAPGIPIAPTFGVKLDVDRAQPNRIEKPQALLAAMFDAARHYSDFTFVHRNPDYAHLIGFIDTKGHHWLQFDMKDSDKLDLFARGVSAAVAFLNGFDWEAYKRVRHGLAIANGVKLSPEALSRVRE